MPASVPPIRVEVDALPPRHFLDRLSGHRAFLVGALYVVVGMAGLVVALFTRVIDGTVYNVGMGVVAGGFTTILGGSALADGKRTKMETAHGPRPVYADDASGEDA